jgi:hypothetical protein
VGGEYERREGYTEGSKLKRTRKGVAAALQFVVDPIAEFGASGAIGWQDSELGDTTANQINSFSRNSVGGFANLRLSPLWIFGGGATFTWQNDKYYFQSSQSPDYTAHLQVYGALQYLLAGQLYIKAVIGYARADFVTSDASVPVWSNTMYSGRIRLMYLS